MKNMAHLCDQRVKASLHYIVRRGFFCVLSNSFAQENYDHLDEVSFLIQLQLDKCAFMSPTTFTFIVKSYTNYTKIKLIPFYVL